MAKEAYKKQVTLLLGVLPEVAKETCFALHGGTAINLFVRDMPRLSIDIDLTYIPIEDRDVSLDKISKALESIKGRVEKALPEAQIENKSDIGKLIISQHGLDVKLEVNLINRGILADAEKMTLCEKAQNEFNAFCAINVVPIGQLYGGKICAALDRQHPRDLFDVKYLLENEGFSERVKKGFLLCLLSSVRPINEILLPHFQDQRLALDNQFAGMTDENFTYAEYENTRKRLVQIVQESLTGIEKQFLLTVQGLSPDWSVYDFQEFSAVKWKLLNLQKLKDNNPQKFQEQYETLKQQLENI